MRKKLMTAVMAWAGLGVAAGCTPRDEVPEQRQDLAEARQEARQEIPEVQQEMREEVAGARQEAREEVADVVGDVQERQEDLAAAREERGLPPEGGMAAGPALPEREVMGEVRSIAADGLVLSIPEQGGREMRFQAGEETQVMHGNRQMSLGDLKPGQEVRASYKVTEQGSLLLGEVEVQPEGQMQQQPQQPLQPEQPMQPQQPLK